MTPPGIWYLDSNMHMCVLHHPWVKDKSPSYNHITSMASTNISSKSVQIPKDVKLYHSEKERIASHVPNSTALHNALCNRECSRRKKIRFQNDNMLDRMNKVRARLQEKLKKKLEKKT